MKACGHCCLLGTGLGSHVPLPWVIVSQPWRAGSIVRGTGDDGLARRAITIATTVGIPVIVATVMTVIAVLVVVLVLMAIVATAGWVR
jgi:hypothetical protein